MKKASLWKLLVCSALLIPCGCVHPRMIEVKPGLYKAIDANGVATWAMIPGSYSSGTPSRWVIYNHGRGQGGSAIYEESLQSSLAKALVKAGYVVVASNYHLRDCWGNSGCVKDIANLQETWHGILSLEERPYVIGESMGGGVAWNAIQYGALHPRAVVGIYPMCSLASMYAEPGYIDSIQFAYAFQDVDGYAAATAGYDPLVNVAQSPSKYANIPILMWGSYSDQSVVRTKNEDPFVAAINAHGGDARIITSKGGHGDVSNFDPETVVQFFSRN